MGYMDARRKPFAGLGKNKDCQSCRTQLWEFAAQEMEPEQETWMQQHLKGCLFCRKEYEKVQQILTVMHAEKEPELSETFAETLHLKLMETAEEMAAAKQNSFKEKLRRRLAPSFWKTMPEGFGKAPMQQRSQQFWHWSGFKIVTPALICMIISVGIFSTGLYQQWMGAGDILQADPVSPNTQQMDSVREGQGTTNPDSAATAKIVADGMEEKIEKKPETAVRPAKTANPRPETGKPAQGTVAENSESVADSSGNTGVSRSGGEVSLATEESPVAAYVLEEDQHGLPAFGEETEPRSLPQAMETVYLLRVANKLEYLNACQATKGLDWKARQQEEADGGLATESREDAIVLRLSEEEWNQLLEYSQAAGVSPTIQREGENKGNILVVVTGDEG